MARWQAAGVDTGGLSGVDVRIADLGGATLGLASGNTIWLDDDAAGWGWFVDPTPADDCEFTTPGDQGEQGRMDLLTVLMHEIGHLLGQDHERGRHGRDARRRSATRHPSPTARRDCLRGWTNCSPTSLEPAVDGEAARTLHAVNEGSPMWLQAGDDAALGIIRPGRPSVARNKCLQPLAGR